MKHYYNRMALQLNYMVECFIMYTPIPTRIAQFHMAAAVYSPIGIPNLWQFWYSYDFDGQILIVDCGLFQVNGDWGLPPVVCDFYIAMDVMCSTSSIFNLVAISIDRSEQLYRYRLRTVLGYDFAIWKYPIYVRMLWGLGEILKWNRLKC